jgi:hypothetical protein
MVLKYKLDCQILWQGGTTTLNYASMRIQGISKKLTK